FETNPRNVGAVRDFNRVEIEGIEPDAIEKGFAATEGRIAKAIQQLCVSKDFSGDCKLAVVNLIALLSVRSPEMRENMRGFQEKVANIVMGAMVSSKEMWEGQTARMKEK